MTWLLRNMEQADLLAIQEIEQASLNPWSLTFIESIFNGVTNEFIKNYFWVVEDQTTQQIIAFCFIKQCDQLAEIYNISVAKDYRKKGIAKFILYQTYQTLLNNNATRLELEAMVSNQAAKQLYLNLGFELLGVKYEYYQYSINNRTLYEDALQFAIDTSAMQQQLDLHATWFKQQKIKSLITL